MDKYKNTWLALDHLCFHPYQQQFLTLSTVLLLLHPQHRSLSEGDLKSDFTTWGINPFNSLVLCSNITTMITTVTMAQHLGSHHLPAIVLSALRALFIPNNLHYGLCSLVFICHWKLWYEMVSYFPTVDNWKWQSGFKTYLQSCLHVSSLIPASLQALGICSFSCSKQALLGVLLALVLSLQVMLSRSSPFSSASATSHSLLIPSFCPRNIFKILTS